MITHVRIQNFRSFLDAEVDLQPFSLIVGANGSGKSNLLKFFAAISNEKAQPPPPFGSSQPTHREEWPALEDSSWVKHQNLHGDASRFELTVDNVVVEGTNKAPRTSSMSLSKSLRSWLKQRLPIFNIDPEKVSAVETTVASATVKATGEGTAQVLDALKNGDREDLFEKIEASFQRYVPEVEKLSLRTVKDGTKQIQVREKGLKVPLPATELSEGTRLILCILTIIHQENPPPAILLEDIDRGMHPRLFEYVAPLMRDIAVRNNISILATTHNPYLVDCFQDHKEAVIIVEKKDGASTLTTLAKKIEGLDYDKVDPEDMPLGSLWYSGLVGGAPKKLSGEPRH